MEHKWYDWIFAILLSPILLPAILLAGFGGGETDE